MSYVDRSVGCVAYVLFGGVTCVVLSLEHSRSFPKEQVQCTSVEFKRQHNCKCCRCQPACLGISRIYRKCSSTTRNFLWQTFRNCSAGVIRSPFQCFRLGSIPSSTVTNFMLSTRGTGGVGREEEVEKRAE